MHALRIFRIAAGMSQMRLAARAELSRETIVRIETGRGEPMLRTARAISTALAVPIDRLFPEGRVDEPDSIARNPQPGWDE